MYDFVGRSRAFAHGPPLGVGAGRGGVFFSPVHEGLVHTDCDTWPLFRWLLNQSPRPKIWRPSLRKKRNYLPNEHRHKSKAWVFGSTSLSRLSFNNFELVLLSVNSFFISLSFSFQDRYALLYLFSQIKLLFR